MTSARHQIAALESWAQTPDRAARTRNAREAMQQRFEQQVDPDRVMSPADRAKAVENARKAYYRRLALKSAEVRRQKAS